MENKIKCRDVPFALAQEFLLTDIGKISMVKSNSLEYYLFKKYSTEKLVKNPIKKEKNSKFISIYSTQIHLPADVIDEMEKPNYLSYWKRKTTFYLKNSQIVLTASKYKYTKVIYNPDHSGRLALADLEIQVGKYEIERVTKQLWKVRLIKKEKEHDE